MGNHCPTWQVLHNIYQCLLPEETCQEEQQIWGLGQNWGKTLAPLTHVLLHHVDGRMLHSDGAAQLMGSSSAALWVGRQTLASVSLLPSSPLATSGSMQWHGWGHGAELDLC